MDICAYQIVVSSVELYPSLRIITDDNRNFRVTISHLASIINIGRAEDGYPIVRDQ